MSRPLVSVVLPCFNAEAYVDTAMTSILGQTHRELEVIAIDDGSTDATGSILDEFADRDRRVRVLHNPSNQGLIFSLNVGVAESKGGFIARMDADDLAHCDRIERQLHALQYRPDIDVIGTDVWLVSASGQPLRPQPIRCIEPGEARFFALFGPPVSHSSLLARTSVMKAYRYGESSTSLHTEDYELFSRMIADGVGFGNLSLRLTTVRSASTGISLTHEEVQIANFVACTARHLERVVGVRLDPAVQRVLVNRLTRDVSLRQLREGLTWLATIEKDFLDREPQSADGIRRIADQQRVDIIAQALLKAAARGKTAAVAAGLCTVQQLLGREARRYAWQKLRFERPPALPEGTRRG